MAVLNVPASGRNIGTSKRMRPQYIVKSQLKGYAPVGIEMTFAPRV